MNSGSEGGEYVDGCLLSFAATNVVEVYRRVIMEASDTSETSVNYPTVRRSSPEDGHLQDKGIYSVRRKTDQISADGTRAVIPRITSSHCLLNSIVSPLIKITY